MINEPNENRQKYLAVSGMMFFFILGFLVAYFWMNAKVKKAANQAQTSQTSGIAGPNGETLPTPPKPPKIEVPAEVTSISGTVEKIEGQTITVKAFPTSAKMTIFPSRPVKTSKTKRLSKPKPSRLKF